MTLWLIEKEAGLQLDALLTAGFRPTALQEAELEARTQALATGGPSRFLATSGGTSKVSVEGVLTKRPSFLAMLFGLRGGASYEEISAALREADRDPETSAIELYLDSPGGEVSGLFECLEVIQATKKPITVLASQACSAAYALASVAGPITAASPAALFGSIGVMGTFRSSGSDIVLRSTEAPKKNPDPSTDEGKAEIQAYLDDMHQLFVEAIGAGRGVSAAHVSAQYGQGAALLAAEAKAKGLIDAINKPTLRAVGGSHITTAVSAAATQEHNSMDLKTLKAQHPEIFEAVLAVGVTQERERVQAHLTMGAQCGDMKIAIDAINQGTVFGHAPTQALYMAKAMNNRDLTAHVEDSTVVAQVTAQAESPTARDLGDQLADSLLGPSEAK